MLLALLLTGSSVTVIFRVVISVFLLLPRFMEISFIRVKFRLILFQALFRVRLLVVELKFLIGVIPFSVLLFTRKIRVDGQILKIPLFIFLFGLN